MRISETMHQPLKYLPFVASSLLLTAWIGGAAGQEEKTGSSPAQTSTSGKTDSKARSPKPPLERNRERWKKLRPAKRKEMKRLFERLGDLPPEQRKRLIRRLRSLDAPDRRKALRSARDGVRRGPGEWRPQRVKKLLDRLSPEERDRFHSLSPRQQGRFLREKMEAHWKRVISRLRPEVRERVEKMSEKERREFLRRRHTKRLLRKTFRDPAEVSRLRSLPPHRLREALMMPVREKLPPNPGFLSEETWRRWLTLEPRERRKVLQQLRRPLGPARGGAGGRDRGKERG